MDQPPFVKFHYEKQPSRLIRRGSERTNDRLHNEVHRQGFDIFVYVNYCDLPHNDDCGPDEQHCSPEAWEFADKKCLNSTELAEFRGIIKNKDEFPC